MNRWWLVIGAGLAVFMVMVDASIVNVALPTLSRDFAMPPATVQWVVICYLLPLLALVLPAGRWIDTFGRREGFLVALVGFAGSSGLCALAPSLVALDGLRALQGGFGALMISMVLAVAAGAVRPEARGRAMGIIATLGPLGAATGPPLGGLLISAFGWRAIFLVNLPVCLLVCVIGRGTMEAGRWPSIPTRPLLVEAVLLAGISISFFAGLWLIQADGWMWCGLLLLAGVLIVMWSRLPAAGVVVDLARSPDVGRPLLALVLLATASTSLQYLSPFFLALFLHASPRVIGVTVLAYPLAMGLTGQVAGPLGDRFGARLVARIGVVWFLGALLLLITSLGTSLHPFDLAWRLACVGIGMGLFAGPNQSQVMGAVARSLMGTAGAMVGLARNLGFTLGPACASAVWASTSYTLSGMRWCLLLAVACASLAAVSLILPRPVRAEEVAEAA